jgi:uncharacterized protein (DUF4213/DUF364 family)
MNEHKSTLELTFEKFRELVKKEKLLEEKVSVFVKPLSPEEAIGEPGRRDFPILIGKERVIEAVVSGTKGQAYTDSPQDFTGSISDVLDLGLDTNQHRAIFIATLNAVLGSLKMVDKTVHCKDEEPEECALKIAEALQNKYGKTDVGLVGLNPAIAERLVDAFGPAHIHITDLNKDNIGKIKFGVEVWDGGSCTKKLVESSGLILFTGTTLVNNTFDQIQGLVKELEKKCLVYGITAAGVCETLGIERICPCGRDE